MLNLYDMIDEIRSETVEFNDTSLQNEDIVIYLNKGLKDALSLTGRRLEKLLYKEFYIDVVAGTTEYDLPKDMLASRVEEVSYLYMSKWRRLEEKEIKEEFNLINKQRASICEDYILFNNKIRIYPTPNTNLVDGLKVVYLDNLKKFSYPFGRVSKIIDGSRIYLSNFSVEDSDGDTTLSINDYVTVTDNITGDTTYTFRVANIDTSNEYIDIFTSLTGLTVTGVDASSRYFTFSGSDLTTVLYGDKLTIAGSTGNDGDYTVTGVDVSNNILYVKEVIQDTTVDGIGAITIPTEINGVTTYLDASSLGYNDIVCEFDKTAAIKLPEIFQDYIIQYAVVKATKRAKEPIEEEMNELLRLAQELEASPGHRRSTNKFSLRSN